MTRSRSCPDENQFAAFVDGELDEPSRRALEAHFADCSRCTESLAFFARQVQLESRVPDRLLERVWRMDEPATRGSRPYWAFSLAAAVVLGISLFALRHRVEAPLNDHAVRSLDATDGAAPVIRVPSNDAVLFEDELRVSWDSCDGALDYAVIVLTDAGARVVSERTERLTWAPGPELRLEPGRYFVWVRAHLSDGRTARSASVSFTLGAQP